MKVVSCSRTLSLVLSPRGLNLANSSTAGSVVVLDIILLLESMDELNLNISH
jgi:hypothetical protein